MNNADFPLVLLDGFGLNVSRVYLISACNSYCLSSIFEIVYTERNKKGNNVCDYTALYGALFAAIKFVFEETDLRLVNFVHNLKERVSKMFQAQFKFENRCTTIVLLHHEI